MHPMMPGVVISPQDAYRRLAAAGTTLCRPFPASSRRRSVVAPGASVASSASRFAAPPRCIAATWVERGFLTIGLPEQPLEYLVDANLKRTVAVGNLVGNPGTVRASSQRFSTYLTSAIPSKSASCVQSVASWAWAVASMTLSASVASSRMRSSPHRVLAPRLGSPHAHAALMRRGARLPHLWAL